MFEDLFKNEPAHEPTIEEQANVVRGNFLDLQKMLAPMFEAAEGMRADLEKRGFSPTVAEQLSAQFISENMHAAFQLMLNQARS